MRAPLLSQIGNGNLTTGIVEFTNSLVTAHAIKMDGRAILRHRGAWAPSQIEGPDERLDQEGRRWVPCRSRDGGSLREGTEPHAALGLRTVEKRTTLRAEWTYGNTTERYFDYVPKKTIEG